MVEKKFHLIFGILVLSIFLLSFLSASSCGNKILDSGEGCDDGNVINGDGCSLTCALENPCPLDEEDYDKVIIINKLLMSNTIPNTISQIIPLSLDAGEYSVTLVARDYYQNRISVFQPNEQYFLSFLKNGLQTAITPSTTDLADYVAFAQVNEIVTENLLLPNGADSIRAVHAKYSEVPTSSPNSVYAICVGIKKNIPEPECSNGILEVNEQCDDGLLNGFLCSAEYGSTCAYCTTSCELKTITNYCGDGIRTLGYEECDDGNSINGDGCSAQCEFEEPAEFCGDETCNDGETCSTCENDCGVCPVELFCGDGVCNDGETCSTCATDCGICPVEKICGNDIIETGEECDDGNDNGKKCDNSDDDCEYCSNSCKIIERQEDNNNDKFSLTSYNQVGNLCQIDWECTSWTSCFDKTMTRECYDKNNCGLQYNKPIESLTCGLTSDVLAGEEPTSNYFWIFIGIIILITLLIILVNMKKN